MGDTTVEILRGIWKDLTDRRGFSFDGVDDETIAGMLRNWYASTEQVMGQPKEPPADLLQRVRGW